MTTEAEVVRARERCGATVQNRDRADWGVRRQCPRYAVAGGRCRLHGPADLRPKRDRHGRMVAARLAGPQSINLPMTCAACHAVTHGKDWNGDRCPACGVAAETAQEGRGENF